jgi:hypothetical protein
MSAGSVSVAGGAGSISADCEDMHRAATLIGRLADQVLEQSVRLHVDLLAGLDASALLDPDGAARAEAALALALDGPRGLSAVALRGEELQVTLRVAAQAYRDVDQLRPYWLPPLKVLQGDRRSAIDLPLRVLEAHLTPRRLGEFYPDGHAVLTPMGVDDGAIASTPPRSLSDVITGLAHRNDGVAGEISVQILTGVDAEGGAYRKVIVDIPGTKDWHVADPHDPNVTNPGTNLRAMAGETTTYENGVIAALHSAGVTAADDVTLVGHSLGGTVAVNAARDLVHSGYDVSHVITAGAPISQVLGTLPRSVQVLALENADDVVPHLDGAPNPDPSNVITATVHHPQDSVGDNHSLDKVYVPGAADVDAQDDPSLRRYLDGLSGQLSATSATTNTYVVTRGF